ncbi:hypothetical protein [Nonomuraea sp. bgisy101]|uniref:hypothetical protein n=1 Tax=Nonomuraea sp. bgisy101 TaxID=3413784 RepID=UPI003D742F0A
MVKALVVIYDSGCGGCSAIASALSGVMAPPVLVRSCRDPNLERQYPSLRGTVPCARPLAIALGPDGEAELLSGLRLMWRGALLVAPGRRLAAVRLAVRIMRTRNRSKAG